MPCTDGGTPVTIERLLGLVKDGTTQSARRFVPSRRMPANQGAMPGLDRVLDIAGLRAVDADDDCGTLRQAVAPAVHGDLAADAVTVGCHGSLLRFDCREWRG